MRLRVRFLALLSGLMIRRCHELWCRLQTRLRSRVAVALAEAGGYSSDLTPSLGTSICCESGPRQWQKDKKKTLEQMASLFIQHVLSAFSVPRLRKGGSSSL